MKPDRPVRLAFLLLPQFSMMAFSAALEPLRAANRLAGSQLYDWHLVSNDGQPVMASNGIAIAVNASRESLAQPDLLVACVGLDPLEAAANTGLRGWLRRLAGHGCQVGGISGGAFLLAEAGLLDGKRCTVHWEFAELFAARYPRARLVPDLFVAAEGVFTCSGGTAALDLMLHFIREHHGAEMAVAVAEQFIHPRIRDHGDRQRMTPDRRYGLLHPKLASIVEHMEANLAEPLELTALAATADLSTRQVERLFRQHLGSAPAVFYLELRLVQARHLLRETATPVRTIALDCGFGSSSHFCHAYRRHFGHSPTHERKTARPAVLRHSLSPAVSALSAANKPAPSRKRSILTGNPP